MKKDEKQTIDEKKLISREELRAAVLEMEHELLLKI